MVCNQYVQILLAATCWYNNTKKTNYSMFLMIVTLDANSIKVRVKNAPAVFKTRLQVISVE